MHLTLSLLPGAASALTLSWLVTWLLLRHRARLPLAAPNDRSLHLRPVPRVGGLAIWAGWAPLALIGLAAMPGGAPAWIAWLALVLVSLRDDRVGVHPAVRLAVHGAAAMLTAAMLIDDVRAHLVLAAFVALAIAWSSNAFNFMDGSDGLAAAMGIVGFTAYALAAGAAGWSFGYWTLVAAVLPLAFANAPPARLFLGDCGAVPLGFLAGACGAGEWLRGTWPGWFPLLVFLPFLADATLTLGKRLARGERVWLAHREHYYQRLHQLGAGHAGTLVAYGTLMLATAATAVWTLRAEPARGWIVLGSWCAALAVVYLAIDYHWRRRAPSSQ